MPVAVEPSAEDLVVEARRRPAAALTGRERALELTFSAAFLLAAAAIAVLVPAPGGLDVPLAVALVGMHVAAQRVEFEISAGSTNPTPLVLVPMLLLLPLAYVPLIVAAAMLLGRLPECLRGERRPAWMLLAPADSWHALGPVAVLLVAGDPQPGLEHLPLYGLALAAQLGADAAVGIARERGALDIPVRVQLPLFGWMMAVDAMLAPVGLMAGLIAVAHPWAVTLVLPLIGLIAVFARERRQRVDQALDLSTAYRGTALLMSDMLRSDDEYTGGEHSDGVVALTLLVAREVGVSGTDLRNLEFAALLHDVGKVLVPKEILNKPGKLTDDEWETIKVHPITGHQLLDRIGGTLADVGRIVRSHHERWDGAGYPDGLVGEEIPLGARIICACDAFSAMTTNRPYRDAMSPDDAMVELARCAESQFDPAVVAALVRVMQQRSPASPTARPRSVELVLAEVA